MLNRDALRYFSTVQNAYDKERQFCTMLWWLIMPQSCKMLTHWGLATPQYIAANRKERRYTNVGPDWCSSTIYASRKSLASGRALWKHLTLMFVQSRASCLCVMSNWRVHGLVSLMKSDYWSQQVADWTQAHDMTIKIKLWSDLCGSSLDRSWFSTSMLQLS